MPVQTITLFKGRSKEQLKIIADCVQDALVYAGYPSSDRFQRIIELEQSNLMVDPTFPVFEETPRTNDYLLIEIVVGTQRPDDMKHKIIERATANLYERLKIQESDVMMMFYEVNPQTSSIHRKAESLRAQSKEGVS
jgi:phenylpyruvate tautomerase PptA (4-oxalocrotonate tautomerase family)